MSIVKKNLAAKVVLDTNVYISAILFDGNPEKIRALSKEKKIELYLNDEVKEVEQLITVENVFLRNKINISYGDI
ncbi:hypothetical protein ES703_103406 [subsurface metagenome]